MPLVFLQQAVSLLLAKKVIAFPTETVYGLGGLAEDQSVVDRIFAIKKRPADNPLICHFHSLEQILNYAESRPYLELLAKKFTPGPLTFLLPLTNPCLKSATCGQDQVCCRIPQHNLTLSLLKEINKPLVGPSANLSGRPSATTASMVLESLDTLIDGVLDGGSCKIGLESTILDCTKTDQVAILRPGAIGIQELSQVLQPHFPTLKILDSQKNSSELLVPGQKYRHYSPQTPVFKISFKKLETINLEDLLSSLFQKLNLQQEQILNLPDAPSFAILAGSKSLDYLKKFLTSNNLMKLLDSKGKIFWLSFGDSLLQIGQNFYQVLASLDNLQITAAFLFEEDWGQGSLALALKNRLQKVGEYLF